ncbi:MAG: hypothetical protein KDA91_06220 [Planctomycetaceae bacterium]|nr:hypothetical protein [Planctomycetaceae bacterium]
MATREKLMGGIRVVAVSGVTICLVVLATLSGTVGQEKPVSDAGRPAPDEKLPAARIRNDQEKEPVLSKFMRQKLNASNLILEGLVTDDLKLVEEGCDVLLKMSHEEKWRISNDMLYRRFSTEFVDSVKDMKEKASRQSIDGTSLAWINATMTCLKCHEWVRNTVIADLPGDLRN